MDLRFQNFFFPTSRSINLKRKVSDLTPTEQELLQSILDKLDQINNKLDRMIEKDDIFGSTSCNTSEQIFYEGWRIRDDLWRQ